MSLVLVTPQHNIMWVIMPDNDSRVPTRTKSNRNRSLQRYYSTLRSIHAKQSQYKLLYTLYWYSCKLVNTHIHLAEHNMTCCQHQESSPLLNLSSCEVSTWFIRPKDNNSKLSCQKHKKYLVYSHTGVEVPWGFSPQIKQGYNQITPDPHG